MINNKMIKEKGQHTQNDLQITTQIEQSEPHKKLQWSDVEQMVIGGHWWGL